ncbi:MAG: hypothetical protein IJD45_08170 [Clostridia bacterium]|nr:hypothetical protein [Clostridia bacterium]
MSKSTELPDVLVGKSKTKNTVELPDVLVGSMSENETKSFVSNQIQKDIAGKINHRFTPSFSGNNIMKAASNVDNKKLLTTIPSSTYNEHAAALENSRPSEMDKAILTTARRGLNSKRALNKIERNAIEKFGVFEADNTQTTMDFLAKDNPIWKFYNSKITELSDKKKKGVILTADEEDMLETATLVWKKQQEAVENLTKLSSKTIENGQNKTFLKATELYNATAYGGENTTNDIFGQKRLPAGSNGVRSENETEFRNTFNRNVDRGLLYIGTGLTGYLVDTIDTGRVAAGYITGNSDKVKKEINERPSSYYDLASQSLREYYSKNGQEVDKIVQDVVTNIARNAIPMALSMFGSSAVYSNAINVGKTVKAAERIAGTVSRVISTATFAPSVFGNAYKEGVKAGITKDWRLLTYATAVTAAECTLEMALGSELPGSGVLSGKAINSFSKNFNGVLAKVAFKLLGNGTGEYVEESIQSLLGPLLKEIFLGTEENTVFDDPLGALTDSAYEGFIGFLSSIFMSGGSSIQEARTEAAIQANGKLYNELMQQANVDIKDVAQFFKEIAKGKDGKSLLNAAENVIKGDSTDIAVGELIEEVNKYSKESIGILYARIGQNISKTENGVGLLLSTYEETVIGGAIYPEKVVSLYNEIKSNLESGNLDNVIIGEFAYYVQAYSPRAHILGEVTKRIQENQIESAPSEALETDGGAGYVDLQSNGKGTNSKIDILTVSRQNKQRRHTTAEEQSFIKKVAKALGVKLEFTHITSELLRSYGYEFKEGDVLPDGYYDKETKTIHIGYTAYNPVAFIFKHELTHFGEGTQAYTKFVEAVKKTKAFKNWLDMQMGYKKLDDLEDAYIKKIARERGYKLNENGQLSEEDRAELHCEMIADFVGKCIFTSDTSMLESMLSDLSYKERNAVVQYILDFLSYLKKKLAGNNDIVFEISRLEDSFNRMISEAVNTNKESPTETGGDLQFSIINLDNGKSYVKASRKVISGNSVAEWRSQISQFFNKALKNGPIEIQTIEGDILTISKETADKARDKHLSENGISRELTDNEFLIKLHAESHIDELAEISTAQKDSDGDKKIIPDQKNHEIAKEGFSYRAVYFQDFDNSYYRITLSVGENNGISTVYNVGKIKAEDIPNGNIVSAIGSKADMSSANNRLTQKGPTVNSNSMQKTENNSKNKLQFSFARVRDEELLEQAERMESNLQGRNYSEENIRSKIWMDLGVMRDTSGEWVYEIEDRSMKFFPLGDAIKTKSLNDDNSVYRKGKLSEFIKHPKLFKQFPELKSVGFEICDLKDGQKGTFDVANNTIKISAKEVLKANEKLDKLGGKMPRDAYQDLYREVKSAIIHEMQHVLQRIEQREEGSSVEYWNVRFKREGSLPLDPQSGDMFTPEGAYWYTKGEYEAREAAERGPISPKYRSSIIPDLGHGKTISTKEAAPKQNLKFSIPSDSAYIEAIEGGDTKRLQEMVDAAAASNGYTERLYHQTGAEFTEFNTDNEAAGKYDWELPTGMFLKPSNEDIGLKGKKQMELFAKIKNPLQFKDRAEARAFWNEKIQGYKEASGKVLGVDSEYQRKYDAAIEKTRAYLKKWRRENAGVDSREIYKDSEYLRLNDIEDNIADEWEAESDKVSIKCKKLINAFMAESGYDGVIIENDQGAGNRKTKSYIVFDSSQLKSAAPVTYDSNGEVISLSQRFNQNKKDIRFSVPSVDSYTEEQYNNFGWVRYSGILKAKDIKYITGELQKIVNGNSRGYVQTQYGDYIIPLGDQYNLLVYTDDNVTNPHIRKVLEIKSDDRVLLDSIRRDILNANSEKLQMADDYVRRIYGEENFVEYKRQNFASFREYARATQERTAGGASGNIPEARVGRRETLQSNSANSEAGLDKPAFSMPSATSDLLDMYEKGEITKEEYKKAMDRYWEEAIEEVQDAAWTEQLELIRSGIKLKKRIRRQNEQLAKRRSEISKEITAQREERATKQKNIEHIRKTVSRIDKMLRTNSDKKHVPEELKEEITKFISVFVENDRSPFDKKDLRNIYLTYSDALRETSVEESNSGLDEDILQDIKTLRESLDGKTLRDLNYYETLLVRNIVDNFAQIIKQANEMFIEGKQYQMSEIGNTAMFELVSKDSKKENALTRAADNAIVYSNMTPVYFFDKIGGVFKTLFDDIVNAQNKWFRNAENGKTFIRQIKEKYHYAQWGEDTFKFKTEKGDDIEITREQAMLLYATAKREYGNDFQKAEHLFRGGVVIEPSVKKLNDVIKKFKASDEKGRKRIAEAFSEEVDSRAHRITPSDVRKIELWLTEEQLAYVDDFVEYLSTDMAVLGNEISMQLYGIRKYNENYYIPYNSAQNFLYSQPGVTNESRLKHQSFTKNTVVGANNPLVLSDFSTVCADHINRMCMYNALTIPLENMNRIFNFKNSPKGDMDVRSIQSEIERVYGKAAVSYIKTFIEDMNGNVRVANTDKAINRWISKFKKGAVFASASVVIQQPSAIMRAMAYIKPKYFLSTTLKFSERDYQECVKYAPVAGIKEMGRFDTGVGAATTNWLLQEIPYGLKNKVKALVSKDSTYRDDKMSYFAAKADEITWAHIWAAVKSEIADTTDLKVGSQEYFEACGKRFTDVVNRTQVYDSTISRSQIMRSKSTGAQMLTAFMSEPTVSLNLLMNAAEQAKTGGKEGKRFAVGAVAAFVGSVALNSLLKSLVTAARDDDEEKTYLEKYIGEVTSNFASDINPLGLIPFVKDIVSIFEGYTVERADMNLFSDLAQSIKYLNSESKTDYEKFESVLGSLAAFLGLPVKNVLRDGRAVYNLYNDIFVNDKVDRAVNKEIKGYIGELSDNNTYKSLDDEDKEKLEKKITKTVRDVKEAENDKQKRDKFDELYAEKRKSQKSYEKMREEMLKEGYTSDEITSGVEIARIAYMKSIGIDVGEYLLYKIATNEKHADKDKSGGVSKQERNAAIREMEIDEKIKNYFLNQHK